MKPLLTCLLASACAFAYAQSSPRYLAYIDTYASMAVQEMHNSGIPASITLAQGLLESGAGSSTLAEKSNNHFGIKCHDSWTGKRTYRKDDDRNKHGKLIESCFRKYDDPAQSYADHSEFLQRSRRYDFLFGLDPTDYRGWAKGLKKAGYATSKTYASKLIGLIEAYELYKYDDGNFGLALANSTPVSAASAKTQPSISSATASTASSLSAPAEATPALTGASSRVRRPAKQTAAPSTAAEAVATIHTYNDVKYTLPQPGEDLGDVARRTRRYSADLVKYNEAVANSSTRVAPGTRIYLQQKRKSFRGRKRFHDVQPGETMQSIADRYAVQTDALYNRNHMPAGTQPRTGQRLQLRGRRGKGDVVLLQTHASQRTNAVASSNSRPAPAPKPKRQTAQARHSDSRASGRTAEVAVVPQAAPKPARRTPPSREASTPSRSRPQQVASNSAAAPSGSAGSITVASGDTLYSIGRRTGVSPATIRDLNDLGSNTIYPGQTLRIR